MFNIRYASIRNLDVSNGEGVGISLFVQGCPFHCYNCFNPKTWDFYGGKEWTEETENKFIELAKRPYIKRISILGGEPLAKENLDGVLKLINKIRVLLPEKTIWLYTGYTINIYECYNSDHTEFSITPKSTYYSDRMRYDIIKKCDVLIDGQYIDSQKDITLKFRGSKNQRIIDIQKSLKENEIVLWEN